LKSQLPAMEEPVPGSQIVEEKAPLGIRVALQFLRLLLVVLILPLLGTSFVAFIALVAGAFLEDPFPKSVIPALTWLGCFIVVLTLVTGTAWMECHLNQNSVPFATAWRAGRPDHPARKLILPALGSIAFYGYAAVLLWAAVHIGPDWGGMFGWPITWGSMAVGATLLHRYLKAKLPR